MKMPAKLQKKNVYAKKYYIFLDFAIWGEHFVVGVLSMYLGEFCPETVGMIRYLYGKSIAIYRVSIVYLSCIYRISTVYLP